MAECPGGEDSGGPTCPLGEGSGKKERNHALPRSVLSMDVLVEANSLLRVEAAALRISISAEECLLAGKEHRASAMFGDVSFNKRAIFVVL